MLCYMSICHCFTPMDSLLFFPLFFFAFYYYFQPNGFRKRNTNGHNLHTSRNVCYTKAIRDRDSLICCAHMHEVFDINPHETEIRYC